jgi:hypothetical protein
MNTCVKIRTASLLIILSIVSFFIDSEARQKAEWKGKVEVEDGIKVLKNPGEPLYGEITFELEEDLNIGREEDDYYYFYGIVMVGADSDENIYVLDRENCRIQKYDKNGVYLQTIGRQGRGPGEFRETSSLCTYINVDSENTLMVAEEQRIHAFDTKGNVKNVITLGMRISFPLGMDDEGNVLAQATSRQQEEFSQDIVFISSKEGRIKTIASYPAHFPPLIRGKIGLGNPYTPRLFSCSLSKGRGIYGDSQEYRLFVINSYGEAEFIIEKESPQLPITKKEKDMLVDRYMENQKRSKRETILSKSEVEKGYVFPDNEPFYTRIYCDDKDRIYVLRFKSPFDEEKGNIYDLFNKEGYYLYRVTMPSIPIHAIRNGRIYSVRFDKDTETFKIIRYKINNYEKLKELSYLKNDI